MKPRNAPQAAQERELDRLANDNARDGGRNTGPVGMAGGAQDAAETKKVLRQLVCPFPIWRSGEKTNDAITHIRGQP